MLDDTLHSDSLIVNSTTRDHKGTVIFLHVSTISVVLVGCSRPLTSLSKGLGQNKESWIPTIEKLEECIADVKWILPQA